MYKGISIILPALNEENNIGLAIREIIDYLSGYDIDYEIIVVNDGSKDSTGLIADEIAKTNSKIKIINHEVNGGYGKSLKDGFDKGKFSLVFFTDSDRQFDIKSLSIMLPLMQTGVVDLLIGYRLKRKDPFIRRFLSWGFNTLAGFLFDLNVKDIDCAFKIFKKEIFSKIEIESKNFLINTEILAKARYFGYNILEVGVEHFPRTAGQSTISIKYIPLTLFELFRIYRSLQKLKKSR